MLKDYLQSISLSYTYQQSTGVELLKNHLLTVGALGTPLFGKNLSDDDMDI